MSRSVIPSTRASDARAVIESIPLGETEKGLCRRLRGDFGDVRCHIFTPATERQLGWAWVSFGDADMSKKLVEVAQARNKKAENETEELEADEAEQEIVDIQPVSEEEELVYIQEANREAEEETEEHTSENTLNEEEGEETKSQLTTEQIEEPLKLNKLDIEESVTTVENSDVEIAPSLKTRKKKSKKNTPKYIIAQPIIQA